MEYKTIAENLSKHNSPTSEGLFECGQGGNRIVYTDDSYKYAFKVDQLTWGNNSEWLCYKRASKRLKSLLATPLYISKNKKVLVMEYLPEAVSESEAKELAKTHAKILSPVAHDLIPCNLRKTKRGKTKVIDYQSEFSRKRLS